MSFGPWPDYICGGDLWGYGPEAMEELRSAVHAIFPNDYVVPVTPTPTSDSVDEEANVGVPGISTEEKSYRITVYDEDGDASYHLDCFSLEEKDVKLAKVLNLPWVARVDVEEVVTTRTILHKLHKEITEWRDGDPTPLTLDDIERGHVRYTHTEYRHVVNCKSSPGWWKTLSIGRAREYALNPKAVTGLYCDRCGNTCPAAEFQWPDGTVVGT